MVEDQSANVSEISDKFVEIANAVENSKKIVFKIQENSKAMENENQNIVQVVESLSAIVEENAATTEEASASVDSQVHSMGDISHASEI